MSKSDIKVKSEPRVYSKESPNSYFADIVRSAAPTSFHYSEAKARLERHAVELAGELRSNSSSRESRHIARSVRSIVRNASSPSSAEAEFRGLTTGSGSGLSFVTPQYLVKEYHEYREYPPSFLEQCPCQEVPAYGMTINLPILTGPAAVVAQASEGTSVGETDPTATYHSATLSTFAGQVSISQQLLDRSGPGQSFDTVAYCQMRQEYDAAIDAAVIAAALAGAQTITDTTVYAAATFIPNLFGDIYNARQKLETAAGTKLRPTHAFFLPDPWAFIASQTGSDVRPILLPNAGTAQTDIPLRVGEDDLVPAGYTGYNFGGVPAFTDGNIPLSSGNAQIIVFNSSSIYPFYDNEPTVVSYPETLANDLQVVVRLHGYAGTIITHASGVCSISGAAYSASPSFAG